MKTLIVFILGLIAAPLIFVGLGVAGWLPTDASSEPPKWESSLGMRILDTSLDKRSNALNNPVQPGDKIAFAAGKKIYDDNCSACHGDATGPNDWGAKGLYPRAPSSEIP